MTLSKPRVPYRAETEAEREERKRLAREKGLSKACGCIVHEGPCWAHTNKILKATNQEWFQDLLSKNCDLELGCKGFIMRDQPRISALRHALGSHYIDVVPDELRTRAYVFALSEQQLMHPSIQRWIELKLFRSEPIVSHPGCYMIIEA